MYQAIGCSVSVGEPGSGGKGRGHRPEIAYRAFSAGRLRICGGFLERSPTAFQTNFRYLHRLCPPPKKGNPIKDRSVFKQKSASRKHCSSNCFKYEDEPPQHLASVRDTTANSAAPSITMKPKEESSARRDVNAYASKISSALSRQTRRRLDHGTSRLPKARDAQHQLCESFVPIRRLSACKRGTQYDFIFPACRRLLTSMHLLREVDVTSV